MNIADFDKLGLPLDYFDVITDFLIAVTEAKPDNIIFFAERYFNALCENICELSDEEQFECESVSTFGSFATTLNEERNDQSFYAMVQGSATSGSLVDQQQIWENRRAIAGTASQPLSKTHLQIPSHPKTSEEIDVLRNSIRSCYMFAQLKELQMDLMVDALEKCETVAGQVILRQGEQNRNFYLITKGIFHVYEDEILINSLQDSGFFGQVALLYDGPRVGSFKSMNQGVLWKLSRNDFKTIVNYTYQRIQNMYRHVMMTVPLFEGLTVEQKESISKVLKEKVCEAGECVVSEGERGDCMYFVEQGSVRIQMHDDGQETVRMCKMGDYFGESTIICDEPGIYSAYAVEKTILGVLHADDFRIFLGPFYGSLKKNAEVLYNWEMFSV